jgi:hypothetical protein
MLTPDT